MKRTHLVRMICCPIVCALILVIRILVICPSFSLPEVLAQGPQSGVADMANRSLTEFSWLEGKWLGNWGPRVAEQVWMEPRAGEMTGLFRVTENDKTLVLELYSLLETSGGIEMRLRHFTSTLVPWEQSPISVLRLASVYSLEKAAAFENTGAGQPSRLTLIRVDADTYLLRTEIAAGGDGKQVTQIRFHRAGAAAQVLAPQKKKKSASH
jgi:uncharacterized protein DUF6265